MPYPQPSGYYGLQLSPELEQQFCDLNYEQTAMKIFDMTNHLLGGRGQHRPLIESIEIHALSDSQKIAYIRWLSDRLAFLHTVPVQEVK